jgi:hypothetical protein
LSGFLFFGFVVYCLCDWFLVFGDRILFHRFVNGLLFHRFVNGLLFHRFIHGLCYRRCDRFNDRLFHNLRRSHLWNGWQFNGVNRCFPTRC